jgi:hypothetical protein
MWCNASALVGYRDFFQIDEEEEAEGVGVAGLHAQRDIAGGEGAEGLAGIEVEDREAKLTEALVLPDRTLEEMFFFLRVEEPKDWLGLKLNTVKQAAADRGQSVCSLDQWLVANGCFV